MKGDLGKAILIVLYVLLAKSVTHILLSCRFSHNKQICEADSAPTEGNVAPMDAPRILNLIQLKLLLAEQRLTQMKQIRLPVAHTYIQSHIHIHTSITFECT